MLPLYSLMQEMTVAPLAGSVDRNVKAGDLGGFIESVAPLAGSVDRNGLSFPLCWIFGTSLPSRGAWIEIACISAPTSWA